ncbi:MAG: PEP-CTERM sorting domain-containing protein [Akkermansiaceae bacterium]|nr:PEP-CTERM sorting domain-containing protein [Akkermansiaceae bacterium]
MTSGFFQGVDQVRGYEGDTRPILRASSPAPFGLEQPEGIYFDFTSFDPASFDNRTTSAILSVTSISGGFNADADPENPFLVSIHGVGENPLLAIADDTNPDGIMSAIEFESTHIFNAVSSVSVNSLGLVTFDVTDLINAGSYGTSKDGIEGVVFFTDLQLGASATKIEASFGDTIFPGFPGSFKSVDGVQICVFNSEPVPEPTSTALALLGALFVLRRKRP